MKKNLILFNSEHEGDTKIINELQHDLEKMEQVFPVFTPDLNWFEQNIEHTRKNSRIKLFRDLAVFWIIALSVMIISFMLVYRTPIIYFVLQAFVLFVFIISNVYLQKRKQVENK